MESTNAAGHQEGESNGPDTRSAATARPRNSYDYGLPSQGNPPLEYESLARQRSAPDASNGSIGLSRVRHAGGVNSLDNFARSWERAAGFPEAFVRRSSFVSIDTDDDLAITTGLGFRSRSPLSHRRQSDLEQPLLSEDSAGEEHDGERWTGSEGPSRLPSVGISPTSLARSFATSYGTIASRVSESTRRNTIQLHREQQAMGPSDPEREHLLVKHVQHEDGTHEDIIVGQSTVPQTVFNSSNVLIGIGLLSLPLAMKHAGWVVGLLFLLYSALVTSYTARTLAKCLDVDRTLVTYGDIAYIAFGRTARLICSLLFCLELLGACIGLVVLFADSLHALVPELTILQWKIICGLMLVPLNFLPLRLLSVTSILGIFSCTAIVILMCIDGLIKPDAPGSLRQPSATYLFPQKWATLPLSFGLIMSPWGGHSVFPNIYRDMRHPQKYGKSLWATYLFTFSLDWSMAILGWLMFGDGVLDEVTANILSMDAYPRAISVWVIIFIAIIPLSKVPLSARPLVATAEVFCGVGIGSELTEDQSRAFGKRLRQIIRAAIRIFNIALIVVLAVVFPDFDRIMAFLGSFLCFTICITFPIAFYLKIFGSEISRRERILDWFLLVTSAIMAAIGTVWSFLPREMISGL